MGVRESVAQLPEKEMRLQEMTIEADKKSELAFDPETEILDTDWEGMKNRLDEYRQNNRWEEFSWQAMEMKLLSPEKIAGLDVDEKTWQKMKQNLEALRQVRNWW